MADLDRVGAQVRGFLADVDLGHAALGRRPGQVADDLGLELVVEHVGGEDGAVLVEAHAVVDDLGLVGRVHRLGRDLGDAADAEGPVGALDDGGRGVDLGREQGLEEVRVDGRAGAVDPAEVAGLRRGRGIGRDGLGDVLPRLAALEVLERGVGLGLGVRLLGRGRRDVGEVDDRLDLDQPGVTLLGRRGFLGQSRVDLVGRDADALGDGELGLQRRVDEPFERDRRQLVALLGDGLLLGGPLGLRQAAGQDRGRDPSIRLIEAPAVDL